MSVGQKHLYKNKMKISLSFEFILSRSTWIMVTKCKKNNEMSESKVANHAF